MDTEQSTNITIPFRDGALEALLDEPNGASNQPANAAILTHGWRGNALKSGGIAEVAARLREEGFTVLRLNLPGHGESSGELRNFTVSEAANAIVAATRWLIAEKNVNAATISLYGRSIGGTACIKAATEFPFRRLVLISPRSDFAGVVSDTYKIQRDGAVLTNTAILKEGLDIDFYQLACGIEANTLIVHGTNDADVSPDQSRRLREAIPESTLEELPEAGHVLTGEHRENAIKLAVEWITDPE